MPPLMARKSMLSRPRVSRSCSCYRRGVIVRITTLREARGDIVMVDGRLDADGLDELERVVANLPGLARLELSGLRSADETALAELRALEARGIALTGVSQYFRLLLGPAKRRQARAPPSRREGRGEPPKNDAARRDRPERRKQSRKGGRRGGRPRR